VLIQWGSGKKAPKIRRRIPAVRDRLVGVDSGNWWRGAVSTILLGLVTVEDFQLVTVVVGWRRVLAAAGDLEVLGLTGSQGASDVG
jgi:hypothetical protein